MASQNLPQLTRQLAWAAVTDAGNRSMRKAGRSKWTRKDFNCAVAEFDRLWSETRDLEMAVLDRRCTLNAIGGK